MRDTGWLARSPCHAAAYNMQTEMSSSPTGGFRLSAGKHTSILTDFQTKVNKKMKKKCTFFGPKRAQRPEMDQLIQ